MPRLPTFPARWTLEDPRGWPYFVFWTAPGDELAYHVRMAAAGGAAIVVSTPDGKRRRIEMLRRPLPRHGGTALLYHCPRCGKPRRYLYGVALIETEIRLAVGVLRQQQDNGQAARRESTRSVYNGRVVRNPLISSTSKR